MKLGILSDIHEEVENVQTALAIFERESVDQIVVLGDVFDHGKRIEETVAILNNANVIGVFGNHELGLCCDVQDDIRDWYSKDVFDFFAALKPQLEIEQTLFCHGLPSWDAVDPAIYYAGDEPHVSGALEPVFEQFHQPLILSGHFHRWFLATPSGQVDWNGDRAITLDKTERHFMVTHAVQDGWCAMFETQSRIYTPVPLPSN